MTTGTAARVSTRSYTASDLVRAARVAALLAGLLAVELILAAMLVQHRLAGPMLLLGGALGLAFVFRYPAVATFAVLALTDFVFRPTFFPHLPAAGTNLRLHELVLGALLLAAVLRPRRRTWGGRAGGALAIFLGVVVLSAALAVESGRASLSDSIAWSRPFFMLAIFWVVVRLFPEPQTRRRLLLAGAVLAAAAGAVALLIALGSSLGDTLQTQADRMTARQHAVGNIERIRLPGLSLGYALFWYVAIQALGTRGLRRTGWAALLGGSALGIGLSFNRNMWFGLIVGLVLILMVGGFVVRARLMAMLAVGVAGVVAIGILGSGVTRTGATAALVERGQTIVQPKEVTHESSLRDRERETRLAWNAVVAHPVLGIGPGAPFGVFTTVRVGPKSTMLEPQLFLHNQYLYLLAIGGIPALLAFLTFLVSSVRRAWSRVARDDLIAACGVGIAMIMVSAIVAIYFSVEDMTAPLGLLAGVIVADAAEGGARKPRPSAARR
jgi:O-antigen ligase